MMKFKDGVSRSFFVIRNYFPIAKKLRVGCEVLFVLGKYS